MQKNETEFETLK